jgi:hypothetical protein
MQIVFHKTTKITNLKLSIITQVEDLLNCQIHLKIKGLVPQKPKEQKLMVKYMKNQVSKVFKIIILDRRFKVFLIPKMTHFSNLKLGL